ncbi:hypothetical protein LDENG_00234000 [Lucifuga dentata]|nr:hypothetical protein LDENG_00234000 [Lucifuga dentata]
MFYVGTYAQPRVCAALDETSLAGLLASPLHSGRVAADSRTFTFDGRLLAAQSISRRHSCMWLLLAFCIFIRNELRCFFYSLFNILLILLWAQLEVQHPVQTE